MSNNRTGEAMAALRTMRDRAAKDIGDLEVDRRTLDKRIAELQAIVSAAEKGMGELEGRKNQPDEPDASTTAIAERFANGRKAA